MIVNISKDNIVVTGLYQYDYGQFLEFTGASVQDGTEAHFFQGQYSCRSEVRNGRLEVPNYLLSLDRTILAYLYVTDEKHGETIKRMTILIYPREKPPDYIDPNKPEDYSRLLPVGGEIGNTIIRTADGYAWKNLDDGFATDEELRKISESIPVAMTVQEIIDICKI